jgi:glucose-1-phosphate cytidylyltransferase
MKAVILAGGKGTRLGDITSITPKPMVKIGLKPILWHIMMIYYTHGIKDFIVCSGYLGSQIKEYVDSLMRTTASLEKQVAADGKRISRSDNLDWNIKVVDTGLETMTGGRLSAIKDYLDDDKPFLMTYGDGLANVDLSAQIKYHTEKKKLVTLTAVNPPPRFGALKISNGLVAEFSEKALNSSARINGGFFVIEKKALDYITHPMMPWEEEPLSKIAQEGQLAAFIHDGFWQPMDLSKEVTLLTDLWNSSKAPWKIWQ